MLEALGITEPDETVYRTLLGLPRATAAELSRRLDRDVRRSIATLEQLGLVSRLAGRPARLVAARPDVAIDVLVARRREELGRVQLDARALMAEMNTDEQHRSDRIVEVIVGRQAIATRFEQLLQGAEHELLVLDRPPYVSDAGRSDNAVRTLLRRRVTVRGIYAPESLEQPGAIDEAHDAARAGEQSRVHANVPMKLAIADRSLALLPMAVDDMVDSAIGIHPSALLDALVQLFELLWQSAIPIVTVAPAEIAASDEQLLTLLAAGLKDDAIARQLAISNRTVSRRVAELLDLVQARTRFQAGIQAARRGWIE
ncbi:MAG TPA: helix-turn-helix domain-containing protein [Jatrophihabitantaceae bacterium]|nr:helix-turn-helix domain-containing protein [Jatrophihabitantaceae bacterium]